MLLRLGQEWKLDIACFLHTASAEHKACCRQPMGDGSLSIAWIALENPDAVPVGLDWCGVDACSVEMCEASHSRGCEWSWKLEQALDLVEGALAMARPPPTRHDDYSDYSDYGSAQTAYLASSRVHILSMSRS